MYANSNFISGRIYGNLDIRLNGYPAHPCSLYPDLKNEKAARIQPVHPPEDRTTRDTLNAHEPVAHSKFRGPRQVTGGPVENPGGIFFFHFIIFLIFFNNFRNKKK